jgi:hypothetical protein
MENLMDDLGRNLSCPAALGRILREACDGGSIAKYLNSLVEKITSGDESDLAKANARSMVLARKDDSILQIRRIGGSLTYVDRFSEAAKYVHTPPSNGVLVIQQTAPVTVHRYRLPEGMDRSAFEVGIPIEYVGSEHYDGSAIVETPADTDILDYECPIGEAWMIRLNYAPYAIETWFFDKSRLQSAFASAVLPETSSMVTLCRVFGAAHDTKAIPLVEELARHEAHFVRWAAIQAMGQIDGLRARGLLEKSCEDPHPHIRAAAERAHAKLRGEANGCDIRSGAGQAA